MAEHAAARDGHRDNRIRYTQTVHTIRDRNIVRLPEAASSALPSRGQVSVTGKLNGHDFRTVIEPDGMRGHWFDLPAELAQSLDVGAGDTVELEIEPAKDWPEPDIPPDFAGALAGAPDIADLWKDITPMARWEWVRWIKATKNPDTRARRVEVAISKLHSGKRRPCCFDLSACTDPDLSQSGKLIDATEATRLRVEP